MRRLAIIFLVWTVCQIPKSCLTFAGIDYPIYNKDSANDEKEDLKQALLIFVL